MSIFKQIETLNQDLSIVTEQLIFILADQRAYYKKYGEHSIELGERVEELLVEQYQLLEQGAKLVFESRNRPELKVVQFRPRKEADHAH
jgi:hypothetical protein